MTLIEKIERALVFAKELGLTDEKTKELMALVLELNYFKLLNPAPPFVPWAPSTISPIIGDDTRIIYNGECVGIVPPQSAINSLNTNC